MHSLKSIDRFNKKSFYKSEEREVKSVTNLLPCETETVNLGHFVFEDCNDEILRTPFNSP